MATVRTASLAWCLQAAAMLACPVIFKIPMVRLRSLAISLLRLDGHPTSPPLTATTPATRSGRYSRFRLHERLCRVPGSYSLAPMA